MINLYFFDQELFEEKDDFKGRHGNVIYFRSYGYEYVYLCKRGKRKIHLIPIQYFEFDIDMNHLFKWSLPFLEFSAKEPIMTYDQLEWSACNERPSLAVMF